MKFTFLFLVFFLSNSFAAENKPSPSPQPKVVHAASEDSENFSQWAIGGEVLGQAILYSMQSSFRPIPELAINFGFSYFELTPLFATEKIKFTILPVSVSYLVFGPKHHLELLVGGDIALVSGKNTSIFDSSYSENIRQSSFLPVAGAGYRIWKSTGGFHFRATTYVFFGEKAVLPWFGVTFGYAFR